MRDNKKSNFSFRGKVKSDSEKQKRTGTSSSYISLPRGVKLYTAESEVKKVRLDFLPYIVEDPHHPCKDEKEGIALVGNQWWYLPFKVHRDVGSDRKSSTVVCPASLGFKCPVCEYQKKLFNNGESKKEAIALYPKPRALYAVVPIGQKDYDETPHIWDMSTKMFHDVLLELLEEDDSNEIFPALDEGKTLEISFKWDTIGEKGKPFPEARNINFFPREPYDAKILDEIPDLTSVLNILSYDDLYNKFFGIDDEPDAGKLEDVSEDREAPPERVRKTTQPKEEEQTRTSRRTAPKEEKKKDDVIPPTWDELTRIDRANLGTMIDEYQLEINVDDFEDTDEGDVLIRKAIAEVMGVEIPAPRRTARTTEPIKEKETAPAKTTITRGSSAGMSRESAPKDEKAGGKDKCPSGHVFGKDTERFDECDTCKLFDDCLEAKKAKK
jgi:hypothetical protein